MQLSDDQLGVLRALREAADESGCAGAAEVAGILGIKTMSAATQLSTLRDSGLVRRGGAYRSAWCLTAQGSERAGGSPTAV